MAFNTTAYYETIKTLQKDKINLSLLFNVRDRNSEAKTSAFRIPKKATIKKASDLTSSICNSIPITCNAADQFLITAEEPMGVNEVLDQCADEYAKDPQAIAQELRDTANLWGTEEGKFAYKSVLPIFTDITADVEADTTLINIKDEITFGLKKLVSNGADPMDLIVAVSTDAFFDLAKLDIDCCDVGIQNQEVGSAFSNKFGVKRLIHVPTQVLSGNYDNAVLDATNTVRFAIYDQELAPFKTYCETPVDVFDAHDSELGDYTHLYGKELMGAGYFDGDTAVKCYEATAVL